MITIPSSTVDVDFNIDEFINPSKTGVFDRLSVLFKDILWQEYQEERIRGTDYANAWIGLLPRLLEQATQYAQAKAKLGLELQLTEAQINKIAADTILTAKQGGLVDSQIKQTDKETEKLAWEMQFKLPKELALMEEQLKIAKAELEAKLLQIPLLQKELELKEQALRINEKEIAIREKEIALKELQIPIMQKELEIKGVELAMRDYELKHRLPSEVEKTKAETALYSEKERTERAQTRDIAEAGSTVWHQNKLLQEQANAFPVDHKLKTMSALINTWITRHNQDESHSANKQNNLFDLVIGKVVKDATAQVGINIPEYPE